MSKKTHFGKKKKKKNVKTKSSVGISRNVNVFLVDFDYGFVFGAIQSYLLFDIHKFMQKKLRNKISCLKLH